MFSEYAASTGYINNIATTRVCSENLTWKRICTNVSPWGRVLDQAHLCALDPEWSFGQSCSCLLESTEVPTLSGIQKLAN